MPGVAEMELALGASRKTRLVISTLLEARGWTATQKTEMGGYSVELADKERSVEELKGKFWFGLAAPQTFLSAMQQTKALLERTKIVQARLVELDQARAALTGESPLVPGIVRAEAGMPWWKWLTVAVGVFGIVIAALFFFGGKR